MAPTSTLPDWLADALAALSAGDVDGWLEMFADDGVHEFPWAAEDRVRRLVGREAMAQYMGQIEGRIVFGPLDDVRVHEVDDTTIVQATGRHKRPDGTPRDLDYIWFITRHEGKVTLLQDHMNPSQTSAR